MADVAALSTGVLVRVAEFLKKVPPEQLEALASGEAKLEIVGVRSRAAASRAKAAAPSDVDSAEVRQRLAGFTSVADATRYLDGLGLKAAGLKALAAELGVPVAARDTMAKVRDAIVRAKVGAVLDADAIRNQAAGS
jgi:hypothetical protein